MKKIVQKSLSVLLSALMMLAIVPAFALAADEEVAIPEIVIEKTSETEDQLVLTVKLTENLLNCFEMQICSDTNLTLTAIEILCSGSTSSNLTNGKIAIANTEDITAPADLAVYTFEKLDPAGVKASDLTITVLTCYIESDDLTVDGTDVTDAIVIENPIAEEHTHVPGTEWTETKAPTCAEEGTKVVYCTECGEIADSQSIPKTEHKNTTVETTPPTCTEEGVEKTYCNDCKQYIDEKTLDKTEHIATTTEKKDATCTESGYIKKICSCGHVISTETIEPTEHVNTHVETKLPSCTEEGYSKVICACGHVVSNDVLPMLEHPYIDDVKAPTCTESGYTRKYCTSCHDIKNEMTLRPTGHSWPKDNKGNDVWTVVKKPTYSANGIERRVCQSCGVDEERTINKLVAEVDELVMRSEIGMNFRQTSRLFVNVFPEEAAFSTEIVWTSSDESVATVNEDGEVYATGLGTATITASTADGSASTTCQVTVKYSIFQWIIVYILFGWIWYI